MKRWIILAGSVLLSVASLVVSELRKVDVPASPAALLYLVADTEQELTRMPVSFRAHAGRGRDPHWETT